jgi:hypothetical protein
MVLLGTLAHGRKSYLARFSCVGELRPTIGFKPISIVLQKIMLSPIREVGEYNKHISTEHNYYYIIE